MWNPAPSPSTSGSVSTTSGDKSKDTRHREELVVAVGEVPTEGEGGEGTLPPAKAEPVEAVGPTVEEVQPRALRLRLLPAQPPPLRGRQARRRCRSHKGEHPAKQPPLHTTQT